MWPLYKYQPLDRKVLSNLAQRKLWASDPRAFNDPFEFRLQRTFQAKGLPDVRVENPHLANVKDPELIQKAIETYENYIHGFGVVCLTEVPDDLLMWSHYADGHRGICMGFRGKDETPDPTVGLYRVEYTNEYPSPDFSRTRVWQRDGLAGVLWTKSIAWAYEKEWRLIRVNGEELIEYPGTLNKMIFGLRTTDTDRHLVRSILKGEDDVEYFQIVQDDAKYKLNIQRI